MVNRIVPSSMALFIALTGASLRCARADTGYDAWLRYARLSAAAAQEYKSLPRNVVVLGRSAVLNSAQQELLRGMKGMLGATLQVADSRDIRENSFILGTIPQLRGISSQFDPPQQLGEDGYWLASRRVRGFDCLVITGPTDRGVLYGTFALLSKIARNDKPDHLNDAQRPAVPLRWVNQWDNLNGTIERGYAGPSIFFENGAVRADLTRVHDYARLLASIGVNGCAINNVNADPRILTDDFLPQLARLADTFRPWGVKLALSIDVSSPMRIGGLDTYDPLDPRVVAWWRTKVDQVYRAIPDFGGFVIKADSEGRPGPSSYGRSPRDAANVVARALRPHGGFVFYRAFVYNHHLDWRDRKADRARAAYDIFHPLDGQFDNNVLVQIKYGPIDFQVREPASPLFAGLEKTDEAIELQITQEYTGQQRHLCFLGSMWEQILNFDMRVNGAHTPVKDLVSARRFDRPVGGFAGVANVGMDGNWLGNPLAMANLFGFGRLAWNPNLDSAAIVDAWTRLTFGNDPVVVKTISAMQLASWHIYESYTGPLGAGTLTNILGSHYGPGIESSERNGWGQWHGADRKGIGMDRTIATGTGFIGQYPPDVQPLYESLVNCPDDLLLFFHHLPYTYVLHSGKTVIQYIYDSHYEGAARAQEYVSQWESLRGRIDDKRYRDILAHFEYQAGHAIVWRDAICDWFFRTSGIPDAKGRVGHHPNRIEAEGMHLDGYIVTNVTPWETASGGKAIICPDSAQRCSASFQFQPASSSSTPSPRQNGSVAGANSQNPRSNAAGRYDVCVQYFDQNNGASQFHIYVKDKEVDAWVADADYPSSKPDGDTSTRRCIHEVQLRPGDTIRMEGIPDRGERAPLDYVRIVRSP
jgi:alpha-glucuronidase